MLVLTIVKESKLLWGVLMNRHLNYIAKSFPSFIKQTIGLTASKLFNQQFTCHIWVYRKNDIWMAPKILQHHSSCCYSKH